MHAWRRRQIDARAVTEGARRDDVAELMHEGEIALELEGRGRIEGDRDVELLAAAGTEGEGGEVQRDGMQDVEPEVRQLAVEREAAGARRVGRQGYRLAHLAVNRE